MAEPDIDELLELLRTHITVGEFRPVKGSWIAMGDLRATLAALERIPKLERDSRKLEVERREYDRLAQRAERLEAAVRGVAQEMRQKATSGDHRAWLLSEWADNIDAALAPTPAGKPCPDCEGNEIRGCSSCNGTGFAPTPAECPRCGSPKPELHPAVQADGGEVSPCSDPFHASTAEGQRILAKLRVAPTPAEEGRDA